MIRTFVEFVMGNFTLTFFVVGLLFSAVVIGRAPKPVGRAAVIEKLMSWFVFWTIGVLYFYNAIFHIFVGQLAAHFIGWAVIDATATIHRGLVGAAAWRRGLRAAGRYSSLDDGRMRGSSGYQRRIQSRSRRCGFI